MTNLLLDLPALALAGVPASLLDAALAEAMAMMRRRHPDVFDRLAGLGTTILRIEVDDLPVAFALALGPPPDRPWLRVATPEVCPRAVIRGSFATLLGLLEGRCDGDGLFFARALSVEGDMEVVVGLRNAVDGEAIDLVQDIVAELGPLGPPLALVRQIARSIVGLAADLAGAAERPHFPPMADAR